MKEDKIYETLEGSLKELGIDPHIINSQIKYEKAKNDFLLNTFPTKDEVKKLSQQIDKLMLSIFKDEKNGKKTRT